MLPTPGPPAMAVAWTRPRTRRPPSPASGRATRTPATTPSVTSQFRTIQEPFTTPWWTWLTVTGAMLAGAISVKFVGLFIVLYVGIFTIGQLWGILGDLSQPFLYTIKHFLARAVCLIAVPIALYSTSPYSTST